jgi:hypothetical protein
MLHFTTIINFARRAHMEAASVYGKYQGLKEMLVVLIERAIDKDTIWCRPGLLGQRLFLSARIQLSDRSSRLAQRQSSLLGYGPKYKGAGHGASGNYLVLAVNHTGPDAGGFS